MWFDEFSTTSITKSTQKLCVSIFKRKCSSKCKSQCKCEHLHDLRQHASLVSIACYIHPVQGHLMLCSDNTQEVVNLIEARSIFHRQLAAQVSHACKALVFQETHAHTCTVSQQVVLDWHSCFFHHTQHFNLCCHNHFLRKRQWFSQAIYCCQRDSQHSCTTTHMRTLWTLA